jgi:small-conductance mechanosensitive channel
MTKKPARSVSRLQYALVHCGICALLLIAVVAAAAGQEQPADPSDALIGFLNRSIAWYHHLQFPSQFANDPSDSIYAGYNRTASLEALALIFEFARERARQIQLENPQTAPATPETTSGNAAPGRRLPQLIAAAHHRLDQSAADLNDLLMRSDSAKGKARQTLDAQITEQKSELDLAQARLEMLENMSAFTAAESAAGLLGKIAELERTVPELEGMQRTLHPPSKSEAGKTAASTPGAGAPSPTPPSPAATPVAERRQPGSGMLSMAGDLFSLIRKMNAQRDALKATAKLRDALNTIREPQRKRIREINQRGEELSGQTQTSDAAVLADRTKQLDALTAEFRRLSTVVLPLSKANILLDSVSNNLESWRDETERAYVVQGRALLVRIAALVMAILLVAVASEFWRRAIFRYIREQRRRSQFMLLRRIVVTLVVIFILVAALSTEIGSLATFAGFLTAGIAVALQSVILSVVAYFFLIGRHGIRVGDRIQIGDVTGDVVDIGLVRLHVVELDMSSGDARPTGRIVTFSNSVVFQPSANLFKQLPGSNFAWRRITLTLAADVDYGLAQRCISEAVAKVYDTYKAELELQHRTLENSLAVQIGSTEPRTRLRLEESGLEIVVLYPVILSRATQIDDLMTHALLQTIEAEPRLRLVGGGLTNIQAEAATAPSSAQPQPAPSHQK